VTFRAPDATFDREYYVDLGGVTVTLRSLGPTHTRGDTSVFVDPDRVLFAGDIVMNKTFMAFSDQSSGSAWIGVLQQLEPLKPLVVVPSHYAMGDATLITTQRTVLTAMQTRVGELKAQNKTVDEAVTTVTAEFTKKYPDWINPARIAGAVRSFYGEAK
jgi:glyoxylase-like metal-dependent hydrolase (beta-lactamase superfamily II)